jgi:hypothetical protein
MLSAANEPVMLSVVMLSIVMLSIVMLSAFMPCIIYTDSRK